MLLASGLSHLQRRCHCTILGGSFELCLPVDSLWHFGRRVSGIAFAFSQLLRAMVQFPLFWEEFQTVSSGLESEPGWLFVAHYYHFGEDSSELLLVTPLAFLDLALDRLGGNIALLLGGSGIDVLIC